MSEIYLSAKTEHGTRLSIAPITDEIMQRCIDIPDDVSGYFLTEEDLADPLRTVSILARIEGEEAAFSLGQMLSLT